MTSAEAVRGLRRLSSAAHYSGNTRRPASQLTRQSVRLLEENRRLREEVSRKNIQIRSLNTNFNTKKRELEAERTELLNISHMMYADYSKLQAEYSQLHSEYHALGSAVMAIQKQSDDMKDQKGSIIQALKELFSDPSKNEATTIKAQIKAIISPYTELTTESNSTHQMITRSKGKISSKEEELN